MSEADTKFLSSVDLAVENKISAKQSNDENLTLSKASSSLDQYCTSNILDESADFIDCSMKSKNKATGSKKQVIICEICKEDITDLDIYNRGVHVNNCIDNQVTSTVKCETQCSENESNSILDCPLCFKSFSSVELRSIHVKKCGKSKGLSIHSILKAVELQERHAIERISLGLPAKPIKPVKSHKNPVVKKAAVQPKNKAQSDIQLARALSLSLTDSSSSNMSCENTLVPVTLKPPLESQIPGKKIQKYKRGLNGTPLLVLRSDEERNKLLLDKVASIIAPMNTCPEDGSMEKKPGVLCEGICEKEQQTSVLWNLCGQTSDKNDYYIEELIDWIIPSNEEIGAKLCNLSQIPGHKIITQLPCDYTFSNLNESHKTHEESSETMPAPEITNPSIIGCLRSLVASSWMSDIDIQTACGTVLPAHKLLLAVRCPLLKRDLAFCSSKEKVLLKWENTSFDVALQFLNFIYTGDMEIEESMIPGLLSLAEKYEVSDLQTFLDTKFKIDTSSDNDKNNACEVDLPSASEIQATNIKQTEKSINMDLDIVYNCINSSFKPSQPSFNESSVSSSSVVHKNNTSEIDLPSASEAQTANITQTEEGINMDLDIVYNCINSSFKPSQLSLNESPSLNESSFCNSISPINIEENNNADFKTSVTFNDVNIIEISSDSEEGFFPDSKLLSQKSAVNLSSIPELNESNDIEMSDVEIVKFSPNSSQKSLFSYSSDSEDLKLQNDNSTNSNDSVEILCSNENHIGDLSTNKNFESGADNEKNSLSPRCCPSFSCSIAKEGNDSSFADNGVPTNMTDEKGKFDLYPALNDSITFKKSENFNDKDLCNTFKNSPYKDTNFKEKVSSPNVSKHFQINIVSPHKKYEETNENDNHIFKPDILVNKSDITEIEINRKSRNSSYDNDLYNFYNQKSEEFENSQLCDSPCRSPDSTLCGSPKIIKHTSFNEKKSSSPTLIFSGINDSPKFTNITEKHNCTEVPTPPCLLIDSSSNECDFDNSQSPTLRMSSTEYKAPLNFKENLEEYKSSYQNDFHHSTNNSSLRTSPIDEIVINTEIDPPKILSSDEHSSPTFNRYLPSNKYADYGKENETISTTQTPKVKSIKEKLQTSHQSLNDFAYDEPYDYYEPVFPSPEQSLQIQTTSAATENLTKVQTEEREKPNIVNTENKATPVNKIDGILPRFKYTDSPITPLPDFKTMMTPEIKQALKKIGVKALPRKKAIALLSHVYDETHPIVNEETEHPVEETLKTSDKEKKSKPTKRKLPNSKDLKPTKKLLKVASNEDDQSDNSDSECSNHKHIGVIPEISFSQFSQESPTKSNKEDIEQIKEYILSNNELYCNILSYKPLNLVDFHQELKLNDIKISMSKLMDFLDEQCITFSCQRNEEYRKKKTARQQNFRKRMIAKFSQPTT